MSWSTSCLCRLTHFHEINKRGSRTQTLRRVIPSRTQLSEMPLFVTRHESLPCPEQWLCRNSPTYTGGPGPAARKHLRDRQGGLWEQRDSLVNHAQRVGILQLHELLRTQIPQLRRYFTERGKSGEKGGVWDRSQIRSIEVSTEVFCDAMCNTRTGMGPLCPQPHGSRRARGESGNHLVGIPRENASDAAITGVNRVFTN